MGDRSTCGTPADLKKSCTCMCRDSCF